MVDSKARLIAIGQFMNCATTCASVSSSGAVMRMRIRAGMADTSLVTITYRREGNGLEASVRQTADVIRQCSFWANGFANLLTSTR